MVRHLSTGAEESGRKGKIGWPCCNQMVGRTGSGPRAVLVKASASVVSLENFYSKYFEVGFIYLQRGTEYGCQGQS